MFILSNYLSPVVDDVEICTDFLICVSQTGDDYYDGGEGLDDE